MTTKYGAYFAREGGGKAVLVLLAFFTALLVALLASTSVLAPQARAQVDQRAVGPVNPDVGYPFWYQDATGLRLELCVEQNGLCLEPPPDPNAPPSVGATPEESNFGDEAFWWAAETAPETINGGSALLVLASEAAFGGADEAVRDGEQVGFGRIRIRVDNLDAGADYRVIHPYGEEIFEDVSGGVRGINFTEDIGCFAIPCSGTDANGNEFNNFDQALESRVFNGFLTWDTFGQTGPGAPPAGYIGDPLVDHAVTGSPTGNNFFRVEKIANADGTPLATPEVHAESDQFSVMGKISELSAVATPRGGEFDAPQQVTLTGSEPAGDIFYTLDGTVPTPASTPYTGPIDIAETATLRYIVVNEAGEQSEVFEQRYVITLPTDISLDAGSAVIEFPRDTSISGQLTSNGEPLANQQVQLLQRPLDENSFSPVTDGQLTTDEQGNFSTQIKPEKNTIYRAVFRGENEALQPSLSSPERVNVRSNVTLRVARPDQPVQLGTARGLFGVVRPAHTGTVRLVISRNGQRLSTERVSLGDNSRYRFVYRPPRPGNYAVRAIMPRHLDHAAGLSSVERFRVNR